MAKSKNKLIIPAIILGVIALAVIIYLSFYTPVKQNTPVNQYPPLHQASLDSFTKCIGQKGAALYGAFWCSHCQNQKRLFGSSVQYLPYVECSTPDGNGQLQVCADKGIKGYPTWIFVDGARVEGEMTLQQLSLKTGCPLPD